VCFGFILITVRHHRMGGGSIEKPSTKPVARLFVES
jgi:hypothetical protein